MTDSKILPAPTYILELSFDALQITQSLQYRIFTEKGKQCEELSYGPFAGTFNFQQGENLLVRIVGSAEGKKGSDNIPDLSVNIVNCTLVSIKPPSNDDLSLFDPYNACTTISDWSSPESVTDKKDDRVTITTTALKPLPVTAKTGQWKISGYLSVIVKLNGKKMNRLYFFDPEGSVGGGGGWGPP